MSALLKIAEGAKSKHTSKEEARYNTFQSLRAEQRQLANKLTQYEIEDNELKIVIQALKEVEQERTCFRLIGGVLCEKTVSDILPILNCRKNELGVLMGCTKDELNEKIKETEKFKEENDIKVRHPDMPTPKPSANQSKPSTSS